MLEQLIAFHTGAQVDPPAWDFRVAYRPVIGFGPDCDTCGRPTLRYGRLHVNERLDEPLKGMPVAIQAQGCDGAHTIYVDAR